MEVNKNIHTNLVNEWILKWIHSLLSQKWQTPFMPSTT